MEYSNSKAREIIADYIHSKRDRAVMEDRLINGMVLEKLAEKYELSVSQVKRIIWKNSEIIFKHLRK